MVSLLFTVLAFNLITHHTFFNLKINTVVNQCTKAFSFTTNTVVKVTTSSSKPFIPFSALPCLNKIHHHHHFFLTKHSFCVTSLCYYNTNMQNFNTDSPLYSHSSFLLRGDEPFPNLYPNPTRFFDPQLSFQQHHHHAVDLSSVFGVKSNNVAAVASNLQYGTFNNYNLGSASSAMEDNSQKTEDTSTEDNIDTHHKCFSNVSWCNGVGNKDLVVVDSKDQCNTKDQTEEQKTLRRLVQNREAARKSRLRKKAYVQQLENSRLRLAQIEQELQQVHQQGVFVTNGVAADRRHSVVGNGALAFNMDYARWVDEHQRLINDIRLAINSQIGDNELHLLVDGVMTHYDELYKLKSIGAKADVFHILSGLWITPAERCFMWLGGFRSSELLKIVRNHLGALTDPQLIAIYNLQHSSQQAEDALSQGMEALQQSLTETLSSTSTASGNVAEYMGQMAIAMTKLATLETFIHQADLLRQQTLHQLNRILTARQAARALLVINDFILRIRALNSLWLACPKEY